MTRFNFGNAGFARAALLLLSGAVIGACGGDSSTGPPGGGGTTEQWATVLTRSWVTPANSESYQCHAELVMADRYYTGFRLASPNAAQTELYVVVRPSASQVGDYDCSSGDILGGEAIYAASSGTTPLTFSAGKGVHVAAGQYLEMMVHINNSASASPVSASTTIEGRVGAAKDVTTPMDMFFIGRLDFSIPADAVPHTANNSCEAAADLHVVAEIPLLRASGTHQTFTSQDPSSTLHTVFDSNVDYQHLVYTTLSTDYLIPALSHVTASCTYVNNTGVVVNFGESAQDEICLLALYRYPAKPPTAHSPYECSYLMDI